VFIVDWFRERKRRKHEAEQVLALMVALTSTIPGNPPPAEHVRGWVNKTLRRKFF